MAFTKPIIKLDSYSYADGTKHNVDGQTEITIEQTVCTLKFLYIHISPLKYYQFYLYDNEGNLLGMTNKIYSLADISYDIENYNNLQTYKLQLYCVSQSGETATLDTTIYVKYNQSNVYADINFVTDSAKALNNVNVQVSQLTGVGSSYTYINGEYVMIADNGYVNFLDAYTSLTNGFVAKLWCSNLSMNVPFLKIAQANGSDYIEVFFVGDVFVAYKYSNKIHTSYISNKLSVDNSETLNDKTIYFSIEEIDGRIDMYATIIS